ncbi:MAG: hypothetical protein ACXVJ5_12795 [Flavisolibacter sp.]
MLPSICRKSIIATAGMTLAGWTSFEKALGYSVALGYGNFLILNFPSLKRRKYNIGKKYALQTFDLYFGCDSLRRAN